MGPPARQRPKAHIQKHAGMVEKEKMDCFTMASNDLSPTENLWYELKSAIGEKKPAKFQDLENFTKKEWEKIPPQQCKKLTDGYTKCLEAVITAKGCATKYFKRGAINAALLFFPF